MQIMQYTDVYSVNFLGLVTAPFFLTDIYE